MLVSAQLYASESEVVEKVKLGGGSAVAVDIVQIILALFFILLLIYGVLFLMKRFTPYGGSSQGTLKIVTGIPVGTREKVLLLQVGDKQQLLIGVSPGKVSLLHVLDEMVEVSSSSDLSQNSKFAERLKQAMKQSR